MTTATATWHDVETMATFESERYEVTTLDEAITQVMEFQNEGEDYHVLLTFADATYRISFVNRAEEGTDWSKFKLVDSEGEVVKTWLARYVRNDAGELVTELKGC